MKLLGSVLVAALLAVVCVGQSRPVAVSLDVTSSDASLERSVRSYIVERLKKEPRATYQQFGDADVVLKVVAEPIPSTKQLALTTAMSRAAQCRYSRTGRQQRDEKCLALIQINPTAFTTREGLPTVLHALVKELALELLLIEFQD